MYIDAKLGKRDREKGFAEVGIHDYTNRKERKK